MPDQPKRIPLVFFRTDAGSEPVREWLKGFGKQDRMILGEGLKELEYGWPVGMPLCRALGAGLWELRVHLTGGRIARVMVVPFEGHLVAINGFVKKSQATPKSELDLARKRQRALERKKG